MEKKLNKIDRIRTCNFIFFSPDLGIDATLLHLFFKFRVRDAGLFFFTGFFFTEFQKWFLIRKFGTLFDCSPYYRV